MDVEYDHREIDLNDKPEEFIERSPTGKVPMIVEDDFVLYESQIINDYLVESQGWTGAYPDNLHLKYRQKVCMKQWDSTVLGPVYESLGPSNDLEDAWEDMEPELEYLWDVARETDSTDCLLAFHLAPFWARFSWLQEYTSFPDRVRQIGELAEWLDGLLEESPVRETLPDREWAIEQYEKHYVD